jgi:hypothetical protein
MRLTLRTKAFDHPDYLFELKHDGFRARLHRGPRMQARQPKQQATFRYVVIDAKADWRKI